MGMSQNYIVMDGRFEKSQHTPYSIHTPRLSWGKPVLTTMVLSSCLIQNHVIFRAIIQIDIAQIFMPTRTFLQTHKKSTKCPATDTSPGALCFSVSVKIILALIAPSNSCGFWNPTQDYQAASLNIGSVIFLMCIRMLPKIVVPPNHPFK